MYAALVALLVFVGGFSVMSLELLAGRVLAPYFGSSIDVWGSVIGTFMLALSFGYLAGGALSLRRPRLARLGDLLLLCAVTCLPLVLWADPLLEAVFVRIDDPRWGSLAGAALLFLLPTFAMGTISPYAVRLLVAHSGQSGRVAGRLYFVSTLGSALGVFSTAFWLVLIFEVRTIVLAVVAALVVAGIAARIGDRLAPGAAETSGSADALPPAGAAEARG